MRTKLLIRAYNVGCGDCFYVCIPNKKDGFHILIDCGKKGAAAPKLEEAVRHLREHALPAGSAPGTKRLDLLVATHRHDDHIKGFNPDWFAPIEVKRIWLSAAMNPDHPQAGRAHALHAAAARAIADISPQALAASPFLESLSSLYGVNNDQALDLLSKELPKRNGIDPCYVHAGLDRKTLGLGKGDPEIHVLAPEQDIDRYYLGREADTSLKGFQARGEAFRAASKPASSQAPGGAQPANISPADFRLLQSRLLSNALGFAEKDTHLQNNVSVVLLIVWKKRRLLFVGDAEWDREFREGKQNGSWNVMWHKHHETLLRSPIDFLKIGHHGSVNATPPPPVEPTGTDPRANAPASIRQALDTLLPRPKPGKTPTAQAVVSTERGFYTPIPRSEMLVELAQRVRSCRNYAAAFEQQGIDPATLEMWTNAKAQRERFYEDMEQPFLDKPQPFRTDLEFELDRTRPYVDIEIDP